MLFIYLNILDIIQITDFLFIKIIIKNFVQLVIKDKIYMGYFSFNFPPFLENFKKIKFLFVYKFKKIAKIKI